MSEEDKPDKAELARNNAVISAYVSALEVLQDIYDRKVKDDKSEEFKDGYNHAYAVIYEMFHEIGDYAALRYFGLSVEEINLMSREERTKKVAELAMQVISERFQSLLKSKPKDDQGLKSDPAIDDEFTDLMRGIDFL